MCIKKVACGLQTVVKEDGRTVLEPVFVEVDCPEDMHRITSKIENCKTVTPKVVEENIQEVGIIQATVQNVQEVGVLPSTFTNEHDGEHVDHGSYGGATNKEVSTGNKEVTTDSKEVTTGNKEVTTDSKEVSTGNKEVVCIDTGEVFSSIRQASRATGIDFSNIAKCCNGKLKSAGRKHWRYV